MSYKIEVAKTPEQFDSAGRLFQAYAQFLGFDLEFQQFSDELKSLSEMYGPPKGALLLAEVQGNPAGAVGLREFEPGIAEMKRLYVLQTYHGKGIGKALAQEFLAQAKHLGYHSVRLDSIRELNTALKLYRSLGFQEIEPYRFNPHPEAVFMEYKLS